MKTFLAVLLLLAVAPATASADHVKCPIGHYLSGKEFLDIDVKNLRAHNLPRRTDGYAPRCLVAEAVLSEMDLEYPPLPARLNVYGARWDGGKWRCTYPTGRAVCRTVGKPRRKVTMDRR
jgi:hypothetical protein